MSTSFRVRCTRPTAAGDVKKGDFIILKTRPCKITEIFKSKTGGPWPSAKHANMDMRNVVSSAHVFLQIVSMRTQCQRPLA